MPRHAVHWHPQPWSNLVKPTCVGELVPLVLVVLIVPGNDDARRELQADEQASSTHFLVEGPPKMPGTSRRQQQNHLATNAKAAWCSCVTTSVRAVHRHHQCACRAQEPPTAGMPRPHWFLLW